MRIQPRTSASREIIDVTEIRPTIKIQRKYATRRSVAQFIPDAFVSQLTVVSHNAVEVTHKAILLYAIYKFIVLLLDWFRNKPMIRYLPKWKRSLDCPLDVRRQMRFVKRCVESAESGASRSPIPVESDQRFRRKPITDSGPSRSAIPSRSRSVFGTPRNRVGLD